MKEVIENLEAALESADLAYKEAVSEWGEQDARTTELLELWAHAHLAVVRMKAWPNVAHEDAGVAVAR